MSLLLFPPSGSPGNVTTIAGTGYGYDGVTCAGDQPEAQSGWAEDASAYPGCGAWGHFKAPYGIAVGASPSDVFITDTLAYAVRKVTTALAPSVDVSRAAFTLVAANASVAAGQVFNVSVTVQLYDAFNAPIRDATRLRLAAAGLRATSNTSLGVLGLGACPVGSPAGTVVCSLQATLAPSAPRLDVLYTSPFATDPASSRIIGSILLSVVPGNVSIVAFSLSSGPSNLVAGQNFTANATARLYDAYGNAITSAALLAQAAAGISLIAADAGSLGLPGLGPCLPGAAAGAATCSIYLTLAPSTPRLIVNFSSPFPSYTPADPTVGAFALSVAPGGPSASSFGLATVPPSYALLVAPALLEVDVAVRDAFGNPVGAAAFAAALPLLSLRTTWPNGTTLVSACVNAATSNTSAWTAACRLSLAAASPSLQYPYLARVYYNGAATGAPPFNVTVLPAAPTRVVIDSGAREIGGGSSLALTASLFDGAWNPVWQSQLTSSVASGSGAFGRDCPLFQLLTVGLRDASGGAVPSNFTCAPATSSDVFCLLHVPTLAGTYAVDVGFNGSSVSTFAITVTSSPSPARFVVALASSASLAASPSAAFNVTVALFDVFGYPYYLSAGPVASVFPGLVLAELVAVANGVDVPVPGSSSSCVSNGAKASVACRVAAPPAAGSYVIVVSSNFSGGVPNNRLAVSVVPGAVAAAAFTASPGATSLVAGSNFTVAVTLGLRDACNNSLADASLLKAAVAGLSITAPTGAGTCAYLGTTTDASGAPIAQATCWLWVTVVPSVGVKLTYAPPAPLSATDAHAYGSSAVGAYNLTVAPGSVSRASFAVSNGTTGLVAGQTFTANVTVSLFDGFDNSIINGATLSQAAAAITIIGSSASLPGLTGLGPCAAGALAGSATCSVRATFAPLSPRLALNFTSPFPSYVAASPIAEFLLAIVPGAPSADNFTLMISPSSYSLMAAPASLEVAVAVCDAFGNIVAGEAFWAALPALLLCGTLPNGSPLNSSFAGNATSGIASSRLSLTVAAPYSLRALYQNAALGAGPFNVTVSPGAPNPARFAVMPDALVIVAGGNFTLTVVLADAYNNSLLPSQVAAVYKLLGVELRSAAGAVIVGKAVSCAPVVPPSAAVRCTLGALTLIGAYTANLTFNGSSVPAASFGVSVISAPSSLSFVVALAGNAAQIASPSASFNVTVAVYDQYGNPFLLPSGPLSTVFPGLVVLKLWAALANGSEVLVPASGFACWSDGATASLACALAAPTAAGPYVIYVSSNYSSSAIPNGRLAVSVLPGNVARVAVAGTPASASLVAGDLFVVAVNVSAFDAYSNVLSSTALLQSVAGGLRIVSATRSNTTGTCALTSVLGNAAQASCSLAVSSAPSERVNVTYLNLAPLNATDRGSYGPSAVGSYAVVVTPGRVARAALSISAGGSNLTAGQNFSAAVSLVLYDALNNTITDANLLRQAASSVSIAVVGSAQGMAGLGPCAAGPTAGSALCVVLVTLAPQTARFNVSYTSPFPTDPTIGKVVGGFSVSVSPGDVRSATFSVSCGATSVKAGQNVTVSATARLYDSYNNSVTEPSALRQAAAAVSVTSTNPLGTLLGLGACAAGPTEGSASCDILPTLAPSAPRLDVVFTSPFPTYAASSLVIGSFPLAVAPGDPSAANFLLMAFSPDYLLSAPASFEVFVGLLDSFGNLIAAGDYAAALPLVSVGATLPGGTLVNATCVGNATSVSATCRLRLTVASPSLQAPYSVRAFFRSVALGAGPFALVVITGYAYPPYF